MTYWDGDLGMRLTKDQATELGQRIVNAIRPTPPLADWVEALEGLNTERAWRVYRTLRDQCTNGLNIAQFMAAYREDLQAEKRRRAAYRTPDRCERCDGSGWVEASRAEAHNEATCRPDLPGGCHCTAVKPCDCSRGTDARSIVDLIHHEHRKD